MTTIKMNPEFSVKRAHRTQLELSKNIILKDKLPRKIRYVAGVDAAYIGQLSIGTAAVLDYDSLEVIEEETACCSTSLPYIPTLLSFRETPPVLLSIRKLKTEPDLFMVDGQGFAHPYRCGFASHLGLVTRKPTVGIAKTRLFGDLGETNPKGDVKYLMNRHEIIGAELKINAASRKLYVSVGHMISLERAIEVAKHCLVDRGIPIPILKAHEIACRERQKTNIQKNKVSIGK